MEDRGDTPKKTKQGVLEEYLQGRVVGILVRGGAQNLNFAVPIAKVCRSLRRCA